MRRRGFLGAMLAACAAPAIITRPGVLMPVRAARILVPAGPRLVIYSGLPATLQQIPGLPLAALALPDNWLSAAMGGRAEVVGGQAQVEGTGVASHFRIFGADGKPMVSGLVSGPGGGGDLVLDNAHLALGQTVNLTGLQFGVSE